MAQSLWTNNSGVWFSPILSQQMREQAEAFYVFRQFTMVKEALGANRGSTVEFTKRLLIDTRGGTLIETNTVGINEIKFVQESVVVTEYGNAVAMTQKATTLAQFDLRDEKQRGLVSDQKDTLDRAVATEFQSAKYVAVCSASATTTITTNGTATATATVNPSDQNIRDIVVFMKKNHIPKIGDHYVGILSIEAHEGLYSNLQSIAQYADPQFRFKDETGRYYGVRVVEDNNVLSNTIGNGSALGEGLIFGEEAVCEAVALPEELRYTEHEDFGRSKKLAWYSILGFKKVWDIDNDNQNSNIKGLERIVRIWSA